MNFGSTLQNHRPSRRPWMALSLALILSGAWSFVRAKPSPTVPVQDHSELRFRWALGAFTGAAGRQTLTPVRGNTRLQTGDRIKMFLELQTNCFVYLLLHNSEGEIIVLFPEGEGGRLHGSPIPQQYYIPAGEDWFQLDESTGQETLYLLVSTARLASLEKLLAKYRSADLSEQPEGAQRILTEVRQIKRRHLMAPAAVERPTIIGGQVRSLPTPQQAASDLARFATAISARNFYSRTITIEHR